MRDGPCVLVLGAYGLIGSEICRRLIADGMFVTGLGRNSPPPSFPTSEWITADLRDMVRAEDWAVALEGITYVVNAAGVLQDAAADDLRAVHVDAPAALAEACAARGIAVVQISAAGVSPDASTAFFQTKAEGDVAVVGSGVDACVLRPTLVLARESYGGTALVRALASVPWVQPVALGASPVQVVDVSDVAMAVSRAVRGDLAPGTYDLTADETVTLEALILAVRRWMGVAPPKLIVRAPGWVLSSIGWLSDRLGALGWRSPLRTTALTVMRDGVAGDPAAYAEATGARLHGLDDILARNPATSADLVAARVALLLPVLVAVLSVFWLVSGLIGLARLSEAAAVLTETGWSRGMAVTSVAAFSLVDIALGLTVLVRRWAKVACLGMIVVAIGYLGAATVFTPDLWLDPLGPLVKVIPATAAALACLVALGRGR